MLYIHFLLANLLKLLVSRVLALLMVAGGPVALTCPEALAEDGLACNVFCGARDQTRMLDLDPIRLMDDEQLFASAETLLNRNMSAQQRMFNYYWLNQSNGNTVIGSRAISKVLSFSFLRYWKQDKSPFRKEDVTDDSVETSALATGWGEYKLRISEDQLVVKYHLQF